MHLDTNGFQIISRLRQKFPIHPVSTALSGPHLEKSTCSVGIEIEIPWRAYFPDLWQKYFGAGKKFEDFTPAEVQALQGESATFESALLANLEKTVECGVPRGKDRFWEFSFLPVETVEILVEQISILQANGLCPFGPYSLHVTIGKLRPTGRAYLALLLLELVYGSTSRIASGINGHNRYRGLSWARKGRGGIYHKTSAYLTGGDTTALELRTLPLPDSPENLLRLLRAITRLAHWLHEEQRGKRSPEWHSLAILLEELLRSHSLEVKKWENPAIEPRVWECYVAAFPSMSSAAKEIWLPIEQCF